MNDAITISSQKPLNQALDYEELRKIGVEHIEKTASNIWTDYNIHDPGITTLELLCYAITDLAYRASNTIPDLLATPVDTKTNILNHFFSAANIFPNKPVTINDFRRLLIDLVGVKNAWLKKTTIPAFADISNKRLSFFQPVSLHWERVDFKGYYDVLLEFDTNISEESKATVIKRARQMLIHNRNLCEDFLDIKEVPQQEFRLCTELELTGDSDPFDTVAQIFFNIQLYLTPLIRFYWLKELVAEGLTTDIIFEGPLLVHGFIKEEELDLSDLKTEIYLSDVMQQVLNVKGVKNILGISLNEKEQQLELHNKWIVPVAVGNQPVINIPSSNVLVYKNGIPLRPDLNVIKSRFDKLMGDYIIGNDLVRAEDISFDTGSFKDVTRYFSVQNHFPKNYGISHWGLPEDSSNERKVQAKQLQGYLYFFDQQMANYLAQLSNLRRLFSVDQEATTYFTQVVKSFKDAEQLFADNTTIGSKVQEAAEESNTFYKRRNLFLDHLLSRFAESFFDYVSVLHSGFTTNPKDVISPVVTNPEDIIEDKVNFLKEYPEYSSKRFSGYDYSSHQEVWDTGNISGLEKRLQRLLGFNNIKRRNLVNLTTEIKTRLDEFNNQQYWFRFIDYRNGEVLLEGGEKFSSREEAAFQLDDALALIYSPGNIVVIQNAVDQTFSYQLSKGGAVIASSTRSFPSLIEANASVNHLITIVTKERSEEGLFLIEHFLLLPAQTVAAPGSPPDSPPDQNDGLLPICVDSNCQDCEEKDPYSFRISIVLPAYAPRFLNIAFRQYCERVIRMEAPAHIFVKICWVGNEQLVEFQEAYKSWLEIKAGMENDFGNIKLQRFVTILTSLRSIYPVARLEDCKSSEERTLFLLNQNALGTLNT